MTLTRSWAEMLAWIERRLIAVSLVGPRRTFVVVQASTKSRVDLWLRVPDREPGGRLLPARSIGNCTLCVSLTSVDDVDDVVVDLLLQAHAANC